MPAGSTKEYAVIYGTQPKGVASLVRTLAYVFAIAAVVSSVIIALGIAFNGVDPKAGGGVIVALIGGEAVLKWITKAGKS